MPMKPYLTTKIIEIIRLKMASARISSQLVKYSAFFLTKIILNFCMKIASSFFQKGRMSSVSIGFVDSCDRCAISHHYNAKVKFLLCTYVVR